MEQEAQVVDPTEELPEFIQPMILNVLEGIETAAGMVSKFGKLGWIEESEEEETRVREWLESLKSKIRGISTTSLID